MAARRITKSAIDWVAFAERVPKNQKQHFQAFKAKSDGYMSKAFSLPENPPEINWAAYKATVSPALVEQFEKQYTAFKIPYPNENVSPEIDEQEKEVKIATANYIKESNERIAKHKIELERWENLLPFDQMTVEDFKDAFPDKVFDRNNPQMWPPGIDKDIDETKSSH